MSVMNSTVDTMFSTVCHFLWVLYENSDGFVQHVRMSACQGIGRESLQCRCKWTEDLREDWF